MELVGDILEHPVFLSMEEYIQHGHTTCRAHCIQVSYMAYKLSLRFGLDAKSTARAGLLHDLFLYDWHTHAKETGEHFHGLTHPRTALRNAREHFVLNAIEEDCILRHMWPLTPIPPKYWEGMMIVYADKVCGAAEVGRHVKAWFAVNWIPKRS
ncbi:MAG: HD family phosphohydrolase [bacterium]|nr:HD family phosphohydrolase [bacterium]